MVKTLPPGRLARVEFSKLAVYKSKSERVKMNYIGDMRFQRISYYLEMKIFLLVLMWLCMLVRSDIWVAEEEAQVPASMCNTG